SSVLKERPEIARRMVQASLRGWADALKDPDEAVRIVLKHDSSRTLDPAHQRAQMKEVARLVGLGNQKLGSHSREEVERVIAVLAKNKQVARPLAAGDVYSNVLLP